MAGTSNLQAQQQQAPIYKYPSPRGQLDGLSRKDYVDLFKASIEGNWEDAKDIIKKNGYGVVSQKIRIQHFTYQQRAKAPISLKSSWKR